MSKTKVLAQFRLEHAVRRLWKINQPLEQTTAMCFLCVEYRLPTAVLSVPVALQSVKKVCLSDVGPQGLGITSVGPNQASVHMCSPLSLRVLSQVFPNLDNVIANLVPRI